MGITTTHATDNLNGLLDKMRDNGIQKQWQPAELIRFLEASNIKRAIGIKIIDPQELSLTIHLTEEEINAGELTRNGTTYKISPELDRELRQLKNQQNLELAKPPP